MNAPGSDSNTANLSWRRQILLFWTLATALPIAVLFNMEVWLESNYTRGLFHVQGFTDLYVTGIFRYRILGRILLLKTYELLLHVVPHKTLQMAADPQADLPFVLAYTVLNGACFFASNLVMLWLCWKQNQGLKIQALPLYFYTLLLMSVSMAVVTPYDQLAYLLLLLAVIAIRIQNAYLSYVWVAISALAGMLNRETEFLATALFVALALFTAGALSRRLWQLAAFHFALCICVYVGLRGFATGKADVSSILTFGGKWGAPAGVVVLALFLAGLMLTQFLHASVRPAVVFTLLSTPYLLLVILTGVLRELRLLCPIILCLFCLYLVLGWQKESQADPAS